MLSFILKLIFFVFVVQFLAGLRHLFRGRPRKSPPHEPDVRGKNPEYAHLTPYEIEDADYEDLPKER